MPKFQVGDLVTPVRDFPAASVYANKTYKVTEVGLGGGPNVRLEGVTGSLPHENNLNLVQRVSATTATPTYVPGDMVEAICGSSGAFTIGGVYTVSQVSGHTLYFDCDDQGKPNCWHAANFKLWVKPGHLGGSPLGGPLVPGDPVPLGQPAPQPWEPEPEPLSPEQARKERIWAALKGAAKQ